MILTKIIALSIALLCFYLAYTEPKDNALLVLGGLFFAFMAYFSFRNKGSVDGPFVYFGLAAVVLFYATTGLYSGEYSSRYIRASLEREPEKFWTCFVILSLVGVGTVLYAFKKLGKQKHA